MQILNIYDIYKPAILLLETFLDFSHKSGEKLKIIETLVYRCQVIIEIVINGSVTFISK